MAKKEHTRLDIDLGTKKDEFARFCSDRMQSQRAAGLRAIIEYMEREK